MCPRSGAPALDGNVSFVALSTFWASKSCTFSTVSFVHVSQSGIDCYHYLCLLSRCLRESACPAVPPSGVGSVVYDPQVGSAISPGTVMFLNCTAGKFAFRPSSGYSI